MYADARAKKRVTGSLEDYWRNLMDFVGASPGKSSGLPGLAIKLVNPPPAEGSSLEGAWIMSGRPVEAKLTKLIPDQELHLKIMGIDGEPDRIYVYWITRKEGETWVHLRLRQRFIFSLYLLFQAPLFVLTGWLTAKKSVP